MLTLSHFAGEYLDLMLAEANAHDDAVIRVIVEGDVINLKIDTADSAIRRSITGAKSY